MSAPSSSPLPKAFPKLRGPRALLVISLLAAFGLAIYAGHRVLAHRSACVLLVSPRSASLDLGQREALGTLLQDHLECLGGLPVASAQQLPPLERLAGLPGRTLLLVPSAERHGDKLVVGFRHAWLSHLRQNPDGWTETPPLEGSPGRALGRALGALPLSLAAVGVDRLLPLRDDLFWALLQGQAWHRDDLRLEEAHALAARVTDAEPRCASAWILRADVLYRRLLHDPKGHPGAQEEARSHFARALGLVPHHPRGTFLATEMRIDVGDQRAALTGLQAAVRRYPRVTALYSGIAYAARSAGLLELARRAVDRREGLCPPSFSQYTAENTHLYLGNRPRFERSLVESEGNPRNVVVRFYKGYLALASGDRASARSWFLAAAGSSGSPGQFPPLSRVFADLAAGKRAEALRALRQIERARIGLRVPDGEFTFKMAEAYALLGQRDAALDMLSRAFAQGFGCSRWYAESPFLSDVRQMPRWRALILHVQERQAILEGRFSPSDFGL